MARNSKDSFDYCIKMKAIFSRSWKSSKQPRKQRKYLFNAPISIRHRFLSAHLAKELIKKYNRRSIPLRKGDEIKIVRGQFKGKKGKIENVDLKNLRVFVENIQHTKSDGTKTFYPLHPSNLIITNLNLTDKKRREIFERNVKSIKK